MLNGRRLKIHQQVAVGIYQTDACVRKKISRFNLLELKLIPCRLKINLKNGFS